MIKQHPSNLAGNFPSLGKRLLSKHEASKQRHPTPSANCQRCASKVANQLSWFYDTIPHTFQVQKYESSVVHYGIAVLTRLSIARFRRINKNLSTYSSLSANLNA
jgi:predicted component of type VI protein secretion system